MKQKLIINILFCLKNYSSHCNAINNIFFFFGLLLCQESIHKQIYTGKKEMYVICSYIYFHFICSGRKIHREKHFLSIKLVHVFFITIFALVKRPNEMKLYLLPQNENL